MIPQSGPNRTSIAKKGTAMRRIILALIGLFLLAPLPARAQEAPSALFQYSTINALLHGLYEGDMTFGELARRGGFGLGTLNRLDGEMVAVDGAFYQVRADGRAVPVAPDRKTPFAVVVDFAADRTAPVVAGQDLAALTAHLDGLLTSPNDFAAFRVDGTFPALRVRSVPAQAPPYRPLAEVIADQIVFELTNVTGTLVVVRMPAYMAGLNVPGYHFHFLTADRQRGGHVLGLETGAGTIAVDAIADFALRLPGGPGFAAADLAGARKKELEKVEKARD